MNDVSTLLKFKKINNQLKIKGMQKKTSAHKVQRNHENDIQKMKKEKNRQTKR